MATKKKAAVDSERRLSTGFPEIDNVLGGGLVLGNTILLGGLQGSGKTTLLLQSAAALASPKQQVVYATGEITTEESHAHARRLGAENKYVQLIGSPEGIFVEELVDSLSPRVKVLLVDSIQTCAHDSCSADFGTPRQIAAVANYLTSFAKKKEVAVVIVSHITNRGHSAVPSTVKHLVDVILRLDPHLIEMVLGQTPVRRVWIEGKSRQGRADLTAYLEMDNHGKIVPLSSRWRKVLNPKSKR